MTYKEIFDRKLAVSGDNVFSELWSRPADCRPDEPEFLAMLDKRRHLEYRVKIYSKDRKTHWMDRMAMLIGYGFKIPYRCVKYNVFAESGFWRDEETAYSHALSLITFFAKPQFGWSSPEECYFKMEAAGYL